MIFIDTGAWIALTDKSDNLHEEAVEIYQRIVKARMQLLTTDYVLDETITRLRYDAGHRVALDFIDHIFSARDKGAIHLQHIDANLFSEAASIFQKYLDTVLSFTDCTSFAVCRRYSIDKVFGFDSHFAMMSISLLSAL